MVKGSGRTSDGGTRRRAWTWLLAALFVAATAWFLLGRGTEPGPREATEIAYNAPRPAKALDGRPSRARPSDVPEASGAPMAQHPTLRGAPPRPRTEPDAEPAPPPGESPMPAGAAAVLSVVLDLPPEWMNVKGQVYALPAGSPGAHQRDDVPHREKGAGDRIELPLPKAGLWDLGYVCPHGHVLVTDVVALESEEVLLRAPGTAPVVFRIASGSASAPTSGELAFVRLRLPDDVEGVPYPGRGQRASVWARVELDEGGMGRTAPLPPDVPFAVWCSPRRAVLPTSGEPAYGLDPERWTVFAGEEVVLHPARLGFVRVRLAFQGPLPEIWRKGWSTDLWTAVQAQREGGGQLAFASTYLQKDGTLKQTDLVLALTPGRYQVEIGIGRAYLTVVERVEVVGGQTLDLPATLALDPDYTPTGLPPKPEEFETRTTLRVDGRWEDRLYVITRARTAEGEVDTQSHSFGWSPEHLPEILATERLDKAQAFALPNRASGRFEIPRRGEARVRLGPAGRLMIVPEVEPDPALGELRLRRPDGWPIPWVLEGREGSLHADLVIAAAAGRQIGPLPVGEHRFEILIGGIVVGEAKATVEANRLRPLPLVWERGSPPR